MISQNSKTISKHKEVVRPIFKNENQKKIVWLLQTSESFGLKVEELQQLLLDQFQQECSVGSIKYTLKTLMDLHQVKFNHINKVWQLKVFHPELDIYFNNKVETRNSEACEKCGNLTFSDDDTAAINGLMKLIAIFRDSYSAQRLLRSQNSSNETESDLDQEDRDDKTQRFERKHDLNNFTSQESTNCSLGKHPLVSFCQSPVPSFEVQNSRDFFTRISSTGVYDEDGDSILHTQTVQSEEDKQDIKESMDDSISEDMLSEDNEEAENEDHCSDDVYEIEKNEQIKMKKRLEEIEKLQKHFSLKSSNKPVLRSSLRHNFQNDNEK